MAEDSADAQRLRDTRDKLCGLLEESVLYDAHAVLKRCADTELWDEQVVLHSKVCIPWTLLCLRLMSLSLVLLYSVHNPGPYVRDAFLIPPSIIETGHAPPSPTLRKEL